MPTPVKWDAQYGFLVEIEGVAVAAFTTASGLGAEAETIEYAEGSRAHSHKVPGRVTYQPVTLTRGVTDDEDLYNWFIDTYNGAAGTGQVVPDVFRTLDIVQLDRDGSTLRRYTLKKAWCKSYAPGDWDANANEIRMEQVVLEYDHFVLQSA
jgi:phage tail-like protein